jgi:hypothetical protein
VIESVKSADDPSNWESLEILSEVGVRFSGPIIGPDDERRQ